MKALKFGKKLNPAYEQKIVTPDVAAKSIKPGMSIFLGTGVAEPRTMVKYLMCSQETHLLDLEMVQLVSLGDAISMEGLRSNRFRLKTFFSGWVASEAITEGMVDLIPSRFSRIPSLIASRQIPIDMAILQITAPNEAGYCSLGVSADVAYHVMEQASVIIGEINRDVPYTFGDTFVSIDNFDHLVKSQDPLIYFPRWQVDDIFDKVAANIASVIADGSCIAFSIGRLYEALSRHLTQKKNLGIHSPFFTDALMDLVKSGAVTNRFKKLWRGRSLAAYALGTPELMHWLHRNPLVEFQGLDKVFNPNSIGKNDCSIIIFPARKIDITGGIALHYGKGNITAGPGESMDFFNGAELSEGGKIILALPSRNVKGDANILISTDHLQNRLNLRESVDMIVTEYGVADLKGRTIRERAQALIELAHPDDRPGLIEQAKLKKIVYPDQIYLSDAARYYPAEIALCEAFKNNTEVCFRAIKPSDEEEMRRLFYRFSDEAVYYRYFSPIKTMPHTKMQQYVNVDFRKTMSIVGIIGESGHGHIIAEARFIQDPQNPTHADAAFVVDEAYQGLGIATYLYQKLVELARNRGLRGFTADVLASNISMMKVFEKGGLTVNAHLEYGVYHLIIDF